MEDVIFKIGWRARDDDVPFFTSLTTVEESITKRRK
jgi:hypothetical protein